MSKAIGGNLRVAKALFKAPGTLGNPGDLAVSSENLRYAPTFEIQSGLNSRESFGICEACHMSGYSRSVQREKPDIVFRPLSVVAISRCTLVYSAETLRQELS